MMRTDLSKYDGKYVRVTDTDGNSFTGYADCCSAEYCFHEYGTEENGVLVEGYLIYASGIASIEETEIIGTAELTTERLLLRRYHPEDADDLYEYFGKDPVMSQYSGWNPYATPDMARETVARFVERYDDPRFYGWVIECECDLLGTIGAYDHKDDTIEVGMSVKRDCWGHGYAAEALKAVLEYLTEHENISCVTAWCAADNIGSGKAMEKAGMKLVRTEKDGLAVGEKTYDKLIYEYREKGGKER